MSLKRIIAWIFIWIIIIGGVIFLKSPAQKVKLRSENIQSSRSELKVLEERPSSQDNVLEWRRNPFVLGYFYNNISTSRRVSGIMYEEENPPESLAIVDGELVRAGDSRGNWRVVQIQKDRVILEIEGKQQEVPLSVTEMPNDK